MGILCELHSLLMPAT